MIFENNTVNAEVIAWNIPWRLEPPEAEIAKID
jgi:hypothetical protein